MPANTISVTRPGKYGNPFEPIDYLTHDFVTHGKFTITGEEALALCLADFRLHVLLMVGQNPDWLAPLRGKDLACWCKEGSPCHADHLMELANA